LYVWHVTALNYIETYRFEYDTDVIRCEVLRLLFVSFFSVKQMHVIMFMCN